MPLYTRQNQWPSENTVIVAGSVKPRLALRASFEMPQVGPKRRIQMSAKLFDAIINNPNQGHLAGGIHSTELRLSKKLNHQLRSTLGSIGCEDIVGVVLPQDLWEVVELQSEKLWRVPLAVVDSNSTYKAIMPTPNQPGN